MLLDDMKKIRRTRWSRLVWPADCTTLAELIPAARGAEAGRTALIESLAGAEGDLAAERSLGRYVRCSVGVLSALLGLSDETKESSVETRYLEASRKAGVPVATLKTRDANLLLDAFARTLTAKIRPWAGIVPDRPRDPEIGGQQVGAERRRELETVVRAALVELSPEHGDCAWFQGSYPILAIDNDPRRLRQEVSYTAGIERRKLGSTYCYQVSSSFRSRRTVPTVDRADVVFCRTIAALESAGVVCRTLRVRRCGLA
jgi:hypothetical protein